MKPVSSRESVCGGGHIPRWGAHPTAGLEGLPGGSGEKMKVSVGPQTVAVVGLCPLPLPSLAPHPIWGARARATGTSRAPRVCEFVLPFWSHGSLGLF